MSDKMVEEMARAIDPEIWELRDADLKRREEWDAGIKVGWGEKTFEEWANRFVGKSLEQAQAAATIAERRMEEMKGALVAIDDTTFIGMTSDSEQTRRVALESAHDIARAALRPSGGV